MSRSTRDIGGRLKKTGVTEIKLTGNYTRADIERIAQRDSNTLQRYGANARIEAVLDYGNHQYRSGKFTKVGEPIIMFDPHEYDGAPIPEPDTFKSFYIYVHQAKGKAGGCDGEWNNCLYYCLLDAYPEQVTEHFGKPSRLKMFLGLDVKQKVSIKGIAELEERLNIRINVKGDHCYASPSKATREVNLILTNTHYKLDKEGTYAGKGIRYTRHNERDVYIKPIVFKYLKGEQVQLYDDGDYTTISLEQFINKKRHKYQDKCEYIRILSGMTLEETLDSFKADADMLKEGTNGIINMYTTGQNINKAAIKLFLSYNKTVKPEAIKQDEGEWILKASCGPMMMAMQFTGPLYKYDISKMYAAIMKSGGFMVPIKCGDFQHLTDKELSAMRTIPFGIYRATINGKHGAFKTNKNEYYTHYDLIFAKELGLSFNLKCDEKANALIYNSSCRINGSILFGKYMDQVLSWIKAGVPRSKELYQRLWGALSKRNKIKEHSEIESPVEMIKADGGERAIRHFFVGKDEESDNESQTKDEYSIDRIHPTPNSNAMVKAACDTNMFDTPFARIMPFIISRGRKMIGTIIKDDIDCIKRVHTDGFVSTKPWTVKTGKRSLDYPKLGKECGDLRYEGYCPNAIVNNMLKPVGEFVI
ncbi:hypothetical protein SAMD00019534_066520 [Acytostelium subglobosum LB1]|uniref:hypothetical protein n=1 Tax=Acytostelium subglobosum LB1 TaxID=1410327 RepID=UPI00064496E5|nr:hypothetical protein SAMD00019534_066520 [Acytostelium subglobosum LB1]GAM23477.1 hypothetical protein SAMD00019534_066520 [Acytostelium subglobosum LB1]|eukprot:XP_012753926.1 hypothetical protein SAMD00019534_066520 [Acytostelium subglobosum LB1]